LATRKRKYKPIGQKSPGVRPKKKSRPQKAHKRAPLKRPALKKRPTRKAVKPVKRKRDSLGRFLPKKRSKAPKKRGKAKVSRRSFTPKKVLKAPKTHFRKLRTSNLRKVPKASHPKRRGKLILRGAEGQERSIHVKKFWDNIRLGLLEEEILQVYRSLLSSRFQMKPSLYARFTFTVSQVHTMMTAGSPKLLGIMGGQVKAWFFATGLSYNFDGAKVQLQKGIEVLADAINDAQDENPDSQFFLEFVTARAYVVKD